MVNVGYENVKGGGLKIVIEGRLDTDAIAKVWSGVKNTVITQAPPDGVEIEASKVDYCDSSGAALLLFIRNLQRERDKAFKIKGLDKKYQQLLETVDPGEIKIQRPRLGLFQSVFTKIGRDTSKFVKGSMDIVAFAGEICAKLFGGAAHPASLRWKETLIIAEKAGADAIGITMLLGFLIGAILAFQSAIPMKQFGADVFVADLVALSLIRELGPLITAFVVTSRSGSAFAAEIGTMKVNEEIDALTTMGIDPSAYLVVPRVLAAMTVTPLLTLFNLLAGLIGGCVVMNMIGYPPVVYYDHIQNAVGLGDIIGGLVKTFVFGVLVAALGCFRGLQTGKGASAVGDSATSAVVSGIVAIVAADGVFSIIYFFLDI